MKRKGRTRSEPNRPAGRLTLAAHLIAVLSEVECATLARA